MGAVATLGGFGVAVACGVPYAGETPTPAPERDASGATDASSDASDIDGTPNDADVDTDARADARADTCDQDKDGFLAFGCDGGLDCDDLDDRAHPDAGFVSALPTLATKGDWNCNGIIEKRYPVNVDCTKAGACGAGFKDDPPCGAIGSFVTCKLFLASCEEDSVQQAIQSCK